MPARRQKSLNDKIELLDSSIHFCRGGRMAELLTGEYAPGDHDFILTDTNTRQYCLPAIREHFPGPGSDHIITILAGESNKNTSSLEFVWDAMLKNGAGRQSRLYCLGGGMITDIGGFAAATFMRGIRFIFIPTTLLGMADAAIGGKTAVNLNSTKNAAGTFALPEAVLIDPVFLGTLSAEEFFAGFAEIVKISLVSDLSFWETVQQSKPTLLSGGHGDALALLIRNAVTTKAGFVARDLKDKGIRQCLNFGHPIGHAFEELSLRKGHPLRHGLAVAAGMVCESFISEKRAGLSIADRDEITSYIRLNFPLPPLNLADIPALMAELPFDKKKLDGETLFSLLSSPGNCLTGIACDHSIIEESLRQYIRILA